MWSGWPGGWGKAKSEVSAGVSGFRPQASGCLRLLSLPKPVPLTWPLLLTSLSRGAEVQPTPMTPTVHFPSMCQAIGSTCLCQVLFQGGMMAGIWGDEDSCKGVHWAALVPHTPALQVRATGGPHVQLTWPPLPHR